MSSLILSHDSHLMMLEIAVENLFVPWTTTFDKVILKKTIVTFRILDEDWISLSPNRQDYRPYQGSNYENEKFYGGISVVFSVPTDFFKKEASGVDVQFYVRKEVCKYFKTASRQKTGFAAVPVDNLLNSIAKQVRERNELAEHLSDFYKRQIISRSMMGTYTLLDENFRNTAATISLYIRISYLGKCLITEITRVKSIREAFYIRGDADEKQPYISRQMISKELQSGHWDDDALPPVPHDRLICRCEELVKKEAADLTKITATTAAIKKRKARKRKSVDAVVDSTDISIAKDAAKRREAPTDYGELDGRTNADADVDTNAYVRTMRPIMRPTMETNNDVIHDEQADIRRKDPMYYSIKDVKSDAAATAKTKEHAIKDNGERAFKKAFFASSKSNRGRITATIGITEREKRIPSPAPSPLSSHLQTNPLCCQLQPHLTCFTDCFDISPRYCYYTACPLQCLHSA